GSERLKNSQGRLWVNVASSIYVLEEFLNLDNHIFLAMADLYPTVRWMVPEKNRELFQRYYDLKRSGSLLRHDCRKSLPFPDNSIDHILCSHFLEHVFPVEVTEILHDFHRALKPGGTLHVIVPDLHGQVETYIKSRSQGRVDAADELVKETLLSR